MLAILPPLDLDLIQPQSRFLDDRSLGRTIDAVDDALFYGREIPRRERQLVAKWIASRPVGYGATFAPTDHDWCEGVRLFTGETISSGAGTAHVLGEEACRSLILLEVHLPIVRNALTRASEGLMQCLRTHHARGGVPGLYCCGRCSVALWRHLAAGGLDEAQRLVPAAMRALRAARDGSGRWRSFPFHYTVLALTELEHPAARDELRYAAPLLERAARTKCDKSKHCQRRRDVAQRALEQC